MIIHMDDYRKVEDDDVNLIERERYEQARLCANGMPALQLALVEHRRERHLPTPQMPGDFEDFDAKDLIDRAYALATQI